MKVHLARLEWMLCIAASVLVVLALRFLYYFALFFEQLVRLWLGT